MQTTAAAVERVSPLDPVVVDASTGMGNETPNAWFIQFSTAPRVEGGAASAQANEGVLFRRTALVERIFYQERFDSRALFNGLSVIAGPAEITKVARMPGVNARSRYRRCRPTEANAAQGSLVATRRRVQLAPWGTT